MKKYLLIYLRRKDGRTCRAYCNALCEQDAIDHFFEYYGGELLRVEFVDYV